MSYIIEPVIQFLYKEFVESNTRILVETGCHLGGRLIMANHIGFKKMYSCDIHEDKVNHCNNLSKELGFDLTCLHLASPEFLKKVLPDINDRVLFWLDAHEYGGGQPLEQELYEIANHHIKNHDILIDDVPLYYSSNRKKLEDLVLSINPNYQIKYISSVSPDYILVAKVPNETES